MNVGNQFKERKGTFSVARWLRLHAFTAHRMGRSLVRAARILHAAWHGQNNRKKTRKKQGRRVTEGKAAKAMTFLPTRDDVSILFTHFS